MFGHAFGSILAHTEAVTEAVALDDEGCGGLVFGVAFGGDGLGDYGDFGTAEVEGVTEVFGGDAFFGAVADEFELAIAAACCWFADGVDGGDGSESDDVAEFGAADDFVPAIDGGVLVVVLDGAEVGDAGAPDIFDVFGVAAAG